MRTGHVPAWIVSLAVLAWLAGAPVHAQTGTARVDRVIDGDTITVRLDGDRYTVRLIGVDTPETKHPTQGVEPYGPEAADYTARRLAGASVWLDADAAGDDQDAYGRLLRYVVLASGEHFNATLIREGYATASRRFPLLTEARVSGIRSPGAAGAPRAMGQLNAQTQEQSPHARQHHPHDSRYPQRAGE